ncbi:RHS repeat domain-containing protein [Barnesiella intestinihominis]|uniref:RHS repeat domain-containing protein n=1 Tax=Barnesiella intestinihominis TaxID=487174 RepID=UPI003FF058D5
MLRTHENRYAEQLDMVYKGNRLTKVSKNGDPNLEYDFQGYPDKADASTEMTYDPNGNMTADLDRGIVAIRYNLLNLPDTVQFENGNRIVYFYYAGGERAGAVTTTYSTPISVPLDSVYLGEDPHFDMWEHRHGNLFYKMGSPSRLLFDGGFFELAERHGGLISQIPYVFVRDHIGSVRLVCNGNTGEVVQSLEYLPSGVIFRSRNFDRQPYRFTGKELLSAHGLDWYDTGARMQEFHIPRFTTMDPLCEKYYSISPYAYCNNNPVKYVDPDGKFLQFAENVSKEFKEYFKIAVEYLNQHNAAGKMADLHASNETYYIAESFDGHYYSPKSRTIKWAPKLGLLTNELVELSPSTLLNHEIDHAWRHDKGPQGQRQDREKPSQYGNKEEERVITGYERQTAIALGEIESGQVTRLNHEGTPHTTSGPTQRDWFYQK